MAQSSTWVPERGGACLIIGEVTGSIDERVRHAVTKLANLHFVSTEQARQ